MHRPVPQSVTVQQMLLACRSLGEVPHLCLGQVQAPALQLREVEPRLRPALLIEAARLDLQSKLMPSLCGLPQRVHVALELPNLRRMTPDTQQIYATRMKREHAATFASDCTASVCTPQCSCSNGTQSPCRADIV